MKRIWNNISNWLEIYLWIPVTFLSIYFMSLAAYWLSGRAPRMNLDWMPELGVNLFKIVCVIGLTSITKEALWGWMPLRDKLENSWFALGRQMFEVIVLLSYLWVLFNR